MSAFEGRWWVCHLGGCKYCCPLVLGLHPCLSLKHLHYLKRHGCVWHMHISFWKVFRCCTNIARTSSSLHYVFKHKMMQVVKGETTGKNGANMTNRVILPLQDSMAICVIKKKKIDFRVNACMYICHHFGREARVSFVERLCSWNCRFRFGNLGSLCYRAVMYMW